MKPEDLRKVMLPEALTWLNTKEKAGGKVHFKLECDAEDCWYLAGTIQSTHGKFSNRLILSDDDIEDVLSDTLTPDQFLQQESFRQKQIELAHALILKSGNIQASIPDGKLKIVLGSYVLQRHAKPSGKNLLPLLGAARRGECDIEIPSHLQITPPRSFIPDPLVEESLLQRIYEGIPATALVGPTGSGKSAMARYVVARLHKHGYAGYVVDAHANLTPDRLFERDDFDTEGTFIQEGILVRLARETKELGLRLIFILEEHNAFADETRRIFYRLFNDEDRVYQIQSTKIDPDKASVDFSHVQFVITANPLTDERYLVDDLKRLSNAEARRLVIIHQGYVEEKAKLKEIFQAIIHKKESYSLIAPLIPGLDNKIAYDLGVDLFREITRKIDGEGIGHDVGYDQVADALWTACLRGHRPDALGLAISEHILNAISDLKIRLTFAQRIRQATNIEIPDLLIFQDC